MERGDVDGIVRRVARIAVSLELKIETICSVGISDLRGHVRSVSLRCRARFRESSVTDDRRPGELGDWTSGAGGKVQESFIHGCLGFR